MNKFFLLLLLSLSAQSNELVFRGIKETKDEIINIEFKLDKVSYINSYNLQNPSRLVYEVNQSTIENPINEIYNYPIKKIRASKEENKTIIIIDLYDSVYWWKPTQKQIGDDVLVSLKLKKDKNLAINTRDIVVAIDAGHGGKYPGAVGPNNILEKDVTLLLLRSLKEPSGILLAINQL